MVALRTAGDEEEEEVNEVVDNKTMAANMAMATVPQKRTDIKEVAPAEAAVAAAPPPLLADLGLLC